MWGLCNKQQFQEQRYQESNGAPYEEAFPRLAEQTAAATSAETSSTPAQPEEPQLEHLMGGVIINSMMCSSFCNTGLTTKTSTVIGLGGTVMRTCKRRTSPA